MNDNFLFLLRDVSFAYGQTPVLSIDSLGIKRGAVTVLEGPNGSGKTTLLKLLNGLLRSDSGTILFEGTELTDQRLPELRAVSVLVHQNPYLFTGTVSQNVGYGLKIRKKPGEMIRKRVAESLALVGLSGFENRRSNRLSGGERQRVAIARALALSPQALLLDEPTANIDEHSKRIIEKLLFNSAEAGTTVILSSHDASFAFRVGEEILSIRLGSVAAPELNIFRGTVRRSDDQFTRFAVGPHEILCPAQQGDFITAVLSFDDVILSTSPISTSAQNRFRGKVTAVEQAGSRVRVSVDCGMPISSFVTGYSIEHLHVRIGADLHVTFKASAVRLY